MHFMSAYVKYWKIYIVLSCKGKELISIQKHCLSSAILKLYNTLISNYKPSFHTHKRYLAVTLIFPFFHKKIAWHLCLLRRIVSNHFKTSAWYNLPCETKTSYRVLCSLRRAFESSKQARWLLGVAGAEVHNKLIRWWPMTEFWYFLSCEKLVLARESDLHQQTFTPDVTKIK